MDTITLHLLEVVEMKPIYKKASIKISNCLFLTMDLEGLTYKQQLYKVSLFCKINYNLKLRKIPNETIWEMRVVGRWINHTSIVLVE